MPGVLGLVRALASEPPALPGLDTGLGLRPPDQGRGQGPPVGLRGQRGLGGHGQLLGHYV